MSEQPSDPKTPAEWQDAVDSAEFCLALDSARQYGLIKGGPGVNVDRCAEILARGAAIGIFPAPLDQPAQWQQLTSPAACDILPGLWRTLRKNEHSP